MAGNGRDVKNERKRLTHRDCCCHRTIVEKAKRPVNNKDLKGAREKSGYRDPRRDNLSVEALVYRFLWKVANSNERCKQRNNAHDNFRKTHVKRKNLPRGPRKY